MYLVQKDYTLGCVPCLQDISMARKWAYLVCCMGVTIVNTSTYLSSPRCPSLCYHELPYQELASIVLYISGFTILPLMPDSQLISQFSVLLMIASLRCHH